MIWKTTTSYLENCMRSYPYNECTLYNIFCKKVSSIAGIYSINYQKSKSNYYAHFWYMFIWSASQQLYIFKTVWGVTRTIGVPYMQYSAWKWPSSTAGVYFINNQKLNQNPRNMHISDICITDLQIFLS